MHKLKITSDFPGKVIYHPNFLYAESILEIKGMHVIFQKKRQKKAKKAEVLENLGKNVQNLKIF